MQVQDIMTSKIDTVSSSLSVKKAAIAMRNMDVGTLLVVDDDQMVGIITDRDICCRAVAEGRDPENTSVGDIMSQKVSHCFNDQDIADAAHIMEEEQVRRLAVLNRESRMVGFLSIDDLAHGSHELAGEVLDMSPTTH